MTYNVVVADDDQMICNSISSLIKQYCPRLTVSAVFYTGTELYDYLQKNVVNIIIADIQMSGYSGLDIAEYVKNTSPDTFILLITGYRVFDYAMRAANIKVDAFLTKPYPPTELIHRLEDICDLLASRTAEVTEQNLQSADYIPFAMQYIEEHYQDATLSLSDIARMLHINSDYLGKLFKAHTGIGYSQYLTEFRINKAGKLLRTTDKSIATIANAVGYSRTNYFRRVFKDYFGCTPFVYRKTKEQNK